MKRVIANLFIFAGLIFLGCMIYMFMKYKAANDYYDDLKNRTNSLKATAVAGETEEDDWVDIDWDELKKENPDIVGWIKMAPNIDYPIVQSSDNAFYLHHDFERKRSINGAVFMHCDNRNDWSNRNTVVYGHNMMNGSMFGSLRKYADQEYAKENPTFYIYVEKGRFKYEIVDYMRVQDMTPVYDVNVSSDEEMGEYIENAKKYASYWLKDVTNKDHIVTLSTCAGATRDLSRQIVQGKLVEYKRAEDKSVLDAQEVHERWENRNREENAKPIETEITDAITGDADADA